MRTRVKICGITRIEDALAAVQHGADAIGLVFYAQSPRNVSAEMASEIIAALPPFISTVGLFVNAPVSEINHVLAKVPLSTLQFHGNEVMEECEQFSLPYFKAIRVKSDTNLLQCAAEFSSAQALLLDTYSDASVGGTGQVFDWGLVPKNFSKPIVLAGGLTAENVGKAVKQVRPYAVDVSGGVELRKGIKDVNKIAAFMSAVSM